MPAVPRSHLVVYALAAVAVLVFGVRQVSSAAPDPPVDAEPLAVERETKAGKLVVHVAGEVRFPGVYRLRAGARVGDAVREAGGPRRRADLTLVNLAQELEDGRQIVVPRRAPAGAAPVAAGGAVPAGPINLNVATLEQLDTLQGVGPATAQAILDYREEHGGFSSVEELDQVPGIGEVTMATLREGGDGVTARHWLLFALVAGLLCAPLPWLAIPVAVALLAVERASSRHWNRQDVRSPALVAGVVALVLVGALIGGARKEAIDTGTLPGPFGAAVQADLTLLEPLRERASGERVGRARHPNGETLLLRTREDPDVEPGDIVEVQGRLAELGEFDEYQRRRGALANLYADTLERVGRRGGLLGALDGVRRRAEAGLTQNVPPPIAALAQGMILGRDDHIDAETELDFQISGLAHLLAVSGTNVLLLATLVLAFGMALGLPLRTRLTLALAAVVLYVPLTGAGPSIQRAGVMGGAGLVAALAGRPASRAYALGLAAAATLTLNPYAALDVGWQLSFAAVIGLATLAPRIREWLDRQRVPGPLAEAGAMTIAATIATAPLLAAHFGRVSLVSLPANLVVAPVVALMMWLGMLACAAAQIAPALAAPFNAANAPLIGFMDRVAEFSATLPHAQVELQLAAPLGYAAMAAAWLLVTRMPRGPALALAGATAACLALGSARATPLRPGETVVSFLDVGQGDATLVRRDGRAILFDTGPPSGGVVEDLEAAGVERLDVLVITHAEDDHEGAALQVVQRFRPKLIVNGGAGWPTDVQRGLAATGVRTTTMTAGDTLRLGELRVDVLWPTEAVARLPPSGSPNDRALVAHVTSGEFDLLLPADAESNATAAVDFPPAEALKVAHHGSDDPGLPAQLEAIRPRVAVIEVGAGNTYGHPTPSTLQALKSVPDVYRTDTDGTVHLHVLGDALWVQGA